MELKVKSVLTVYEKFGYQKLGPFLYGFAEWLYDSFEKREPDKILFLARDGYMLQKVYETLYPQHQQICEYTYFSRNSIRRALLWTAETYEETIKYIMYTKYISFSELALYYGISKEEYQECSEKYFDWDEDIRYDTLAKNLKMKRIYELFKEKINEQSYTQYTILVKYLKQLNLVGKKVAIVDVGWNGSIQNNLKRLIGISGLKISLVGYYIGIAPPEELKNEVCGYLYDNKNDARRKELLCFFGVVEKFLQIQEGSTGGYTIVANRVYPIKEEYEYIEDKNITDALVSVQKGALQYAINAKCNNKIERNYQVYAKKLIRFGKSPRLSEIRLFRPLYNFDGKKAYFLPQKPIWKYKASEFMHALSNSCWKTGFMKATFKFPMPYYWIYKNLKS